MKDYLSLIEEALDRYSAAFDLPELFRKSMRYSLLSGGKRIRACLCLACCELVGGQVEDYCIGFISTNKDLHRAVAGRTEVREQMGELL